MIWSSLWLRSAMDRLPLPSIVIHPLKFTDSSA